MRCRTASRLMSLKIDGVLRPQQAAGLERHLRSCPRCRTTWASMLRVNGLMAQTAWSEPSPGLPARVLHRLPTSRRAVVPTAMPVWTRAGMVVLATVLLLFIALASLVTLLGLGPEAGEWALIAQGGREVIAAGWDSLVQLFAALEAVAGAL